MAKHEKPDLDNEQLRNAEKRAGRDEPLGRGMSSPDSTQVPLSAETGEPDERAVRGDESAQRDRPGRNESRR